MSDDGFGIWIFVAFALFVVSLILFLAAAIAFVLWLAAVVEDWYERRHTK